MDQININTKPVAPVDPVAEEVVEERPDGTVVRRRTVVERPAVPVPPGEVNVNVPPDRTGSTNVNIPR